ncbi:hypothetical protein BsWGS_19343 [Bradybaena similaris]
MIVSGVLQTTSMDATTLMQQSPDMTTCDIVTSAISIASREGRLIYGLNDCVTALRRNPNDVVACIVPVSTSSNDVNKNIQTLLIKSICLEYDILILKLDVSVLQSGMSSLDAVSKKGSQKLISGNVFADSDLECFLIQCSTESMSCTDLKLLHLYQDVWNDRQVFPE